MRAALGDVPADHGPAHADHRAQRHRLGRPNKHEHAEAHGAPLGEEEIRLTKAAYGWPAGREVPACPRKCGHISASTSARAGQRLQPGVGGQVRRVQEAVSRSWPRSSKRSARGELPEGWDAEIKPFPADAKGMASRGFVGQGAQPGGQAGAVAAGRLGRPGPLDQARCWTSTAPATSRPAATPGRNFHFGIREHGMGAICNGMALCGLRPYGATFFVFTDYMRPSIRLAAIMGLPVLYVFTHDSIGVGEDGPTHQPIEHLAALRAIPNLVVLRPGDANEVAEAYKAAMQLQGPAGRHRPHAAEPAHARPHEVRPGRRPAPGRLRAGRRARTASREVILIGTGSELSLCVAAYEKLPAEGRQGPRGEHAELGTVRRAAGRVSRRGAAAGGDRARGGRVGRRAGLVQVHRPAAGGSSGMSTFGASGPVGVLLKHFGFTVENVAAAAREVMKG